MSTTTITFDPTTQDPRLLAAFRDLFGMQSNTPAQVQAEYKRWLIRLSANVVREYEDRVQKNALPPPALFEPT